MFFLDDFYLCLVSFELLFKRLCCIITEGSLPSNILQHHIKITVTNTFSDDSWSDLNPCSWQIAVVGRILNQDSGQDLRQAQSPVNGMTWQVWGEGEKRVFQWRVHLKASFESLLWEVKAKQVSPWKFPAVGLPRFWRMHDSLLLKGLLDGVAGTAMKVNYDKHRNRNLYF